MRSSTRDKGLAGSMLSAACRNASSRETRNSGFPVDMLFRWGRAKQRWGRGGGRFGPGQEQLANGVCTGTDSCHLICGCSVLQLGQARTKRLIIHTICRVTASPFSEIFFSTVAEFTTWPSSDKKDGHPHHNFSPREFFPRKLSLQQQCRTT